MAIRGVDLRTPFDGLRARCTQTVVAPSDRDDRLDAHCFARDNHAIHHALHQLLTTLEPKRVDPVRDLGAESFDFIDQSER